MTSTDLKQRNHGDFAKCSPIFSALHVTNCAKVTDGGRPLLPEILSQSGRVGAKFEQ